jgi:hypothetical protein
MRRSRIAFSTDRLTHQPHNPRINAARIGQIHNCFRNSKLVNATERKKLRDAERTALAVLDVDLVFSNADLLMRIGSH